MEDDQSPTSKWGGVASKIKLHQSKLTLKEYLPQLQALLDVENLEACDKDASKIIKALVLPVDALGQVVQKLAAGKTLLIGQNYGAKRTRKTTFEQQTEQNIVATDKSDASPPGVHFDRKKYKGNIESMKRHQIVDTFIE